MSEIGLSLFDNQVYKLVVNAPKLEHFHLSDSVTLEFSLVNLSSLLKAKVCTLLSRSGPPTNYGPNASKLLRGIANVKFLDVSFLYSLSILERGCFECYFLMSYSFRKDIRNFIFRFLLIQISKALFIV